MMEHFEVIIVGAGISGIGAAVHLRRQCPARSVVILEGRTNIGGTWDLFRYPGIRSDSDMYTLGYSFKPWTLAKAIADGPSILKYLNEAAREEGIHDKIRFGHHVTAAAWDSGAARWLVTMQHDGKDLRLSCNFLHMCSGYYDYAAGFTPEFAGRERFAGRIVHPQHWPADLDYRGKRVVVIGSGATAMTLVPTLTRDAGQVTMLQRSPTYVISRPAEDRFANTLKRLLPPMLAYGIIRWRNTFFHQLVFGLARTWPGVVRKYLLARVRDQLDPGYDTASHFTPRYKPWEQRLCLVPDGDLFAAIRSGQASVVTATGLKLLFLAGMAVTVDGRKVDFSRTFGYKGMMFSGVPNLSCVFGYTNSSWTLKADLESDYLCRLLNHMQASGEQIVTPVADPGIKPERWIDFSSSYFERALGSFPKQGSKAPWKLYQNYFKDILLFRFARLADDSLRFSKAGQAVDIA
ncbi:MAG: NAD(P)/FAD-dependent oxidoreductase [Dechloromonas sp.]|nr:NAD(P)/FAD-dependent oxidoreductase [Candidatus Dechloromonas phosphoritropha]MBP6707575.1 NAD(P)/FAD-dependent oxidoreductase [Accumulibacter sp.]MBP8786376.1 NAD(P)/FAD-dependent oxidoreductase [Azonexus sp.]MBP9228029.1 NAD(P)/FAD-dependent oxidoreductase [Azonexus sp.]